MLETKKTKRYLNHGIASTTPPCPPFYPHFDMPKLPIHLSRPYGPPAYPKPVYGPPTSPPISQYHQQQQAYIPQPSSLEWTKPQVTIPIYQAQQYQHEKEIVHIKPMMRAQENNYWQLLQTYEKPQHAYAPNYHVPMFLSTTRKDWIKPVNYHAAEANRFNNPGIIYKDDHPKDCKPCTNQQISYQSIHQRIASPQIIHVQPAYAKPIINQAPIRPVPHYLPAPPQSHIVKHHEHVEPCDK